MKKLSVTLAVLILVLCLPVSAGAVSASDEVTIETEVFTGFDITVPQSVAQKYRWEEFSFEGTYTINFYDRALYDSTDETAISAQARGYRFSISQYSYDSDYRYGMGDPAYSELFQPTRDRIAFFFTRDGISQQPMLLTVAYVDSVPMSVEQDAMEIVGGMTPEQDVHLEDVDANPWNLPFANFFLNGQFRTMGQVYFDDAEMQACLYNVAGNEYPELIITDGAADGQTSLAHVYTLNDDRLVEYLRTATTEELSAMNLVPFTSIRLGWGSFLETCGYHIVYLNNPVNASDWLGVFQYDDGDKGELFVVEESNDSQVRGVYVFRKESGEYEKRDFVWTKEDDTTASEPFQNGVDSIYYRLEDGRILADYPNGWWPDRTYERVSDIDDFEADIRDPSTYEYQGDWFWFDEYGTERGVVTLSAESNTHLSGDICLYRSDKNANYSLEMDLDGTTATISSTSGVIEGTAKFGEDEIWFYLNDKRLSDGAMISSAFKTTTFCFIKSSSQPKDFIKKYNTAVNYSDSLFSGLPRNYNYELAKLGGILSCAAEKSERELVEILEMLEVDDYDTENFGLLGTYAFAFAYKEIELNGEDTALLFIIARGTTKPWEGIADANDSTTPFYGYSAYDTPYDFYSQVNDALTKYLNEIGLEPGVYPTKIFVTGRSLGGACANLVAAQFRLSDKWHSSLNPTEDVFAYTYGAIDSLSVKENDRTPVSEGFRNIHNIYNLYDTFSHRGIQLGPTTAGDDMFGKFGHIDFFSHQYSTHNNIAATKNHNMESYLNSIVEHEVNCNNRFAYNAIHCPVDVEVLKDGEVVGRITDNQVDEALLAANPEVALMVVEDSKHIGVFDDPEAYSLRITATDDGEMSVSTVSFDDTGESYGAAEYPNVAIKTGQVFSMELPATDSAGSVPQTPELLVMDGDRIIGKVDTDGTITPVHGAGNGLQLVLLAAIVIVSGLVVFLGGRKMKEGKKLKFPIASVFSIPLILGLIENLRYQLFRAGMLDQKIGYRMAVEFGSTYSVPHILYQVLLIGSMLLLAVLLFMRKRNGLLAGALAIQALLPAFTLVSFLLNCSSRGFFDVYEYELHFGPMMWAIGICGCYVLEILCYSLFTFMAITPCTEDNGNKRRQLWFLPGVLSILIVFAHSVGNIYFMRSDLYFLSILFLIPMTFLLGWWLTHPYKKEKPVYQMPIAHPYEGPVYQRVGAFQVAQNPICTNCGRELPSDEIFCAGCGTRRPEPPRAEPDHAEQKVFCPGCGRELPPDEDFCGACGTKRPTTQEGGHTDQEIN